MKHDKTTGSGVTASRSRNNLKLNPRPAARDPCRLALLKPDCQDIYSQPAIDSSFIF